MKQLIFLIAFSPFIFLSKDSLAQKMWMSDVAGNWNNPANWTGGSVPVIGESVTFNAVHNGNCLLDIVPPVLDGIVINGYTGTIDLQGRSLTSSGTVNSNFTTGTIINSGVAASITITTAGNGITTGLTTFQGTNFGTIASPNVQLNVTSGSILLNGSTFRAPVFFIKTADNFDNGAGGNIFNNSVSIVNNSGSQITLAGTNPDVFNGVVTLRTNNTGRISISDFSGSTTFNNNVIVESVNGGGVIFGNTGPGTVTLSAGRTISVGAAGFNSGELRLKRFTQIGATTQSLTLTGTSYLTLGISAAQPTTFNGNVTFTAPQVDIDGATFNGTTIIEKNGTGHNTCDGGNTFNGTTTIRYTFAGPSIWAFAFLQGDRFNGDVTFEAPVANIFRPAFNGTNFFSNGITINSVGTLTFGLGTGIVELSGPNNQAINKTLGSASPVFQRLRLNKSANSCTLNTDVTVGITGTFTSGVLNASVTNFLNFADNATTTGASNASHVDGPVRKTGDDAFTFPEGDNGIYRPISISAPANITDAFTAEYVHAAQSFGVIMDPSFARLSSCEYWVLDRNAGASNVNVTLSWNSSDCAGTYITDPNLPDLRVARWDGAQWVNHGNGSTTGNAASGTIVTSAPVTNFSPFTLASITILNPLPIELGSFIAVPEKNIVRLKWTTLSEINYNFFTVQRSINGMQFESIGIVKAKGSNVGSTLYIYDDTEPINGSSYYRLKQTDFDDNIFYSSPVFVHENFNVLPIIIYPNPAFKNQIVSLNKYADLVILNDLNQVVFEAKHVKEIDISFFQSGAYIVKTRNGECLRLIVL